MSFQPQQHYDVLALDTGIGPLAAAALLARRGWRVVVLEATMPPTYRFETFSLARRPFVFLAQRSPVWHRLLSELAQSKHFPRRLVSWGQGLQVLAPGIRFAFTPSSPSFAEECARIFPKDVSWMIAFYGQLASFCAEGDAALCKDRSLPPSGLWERMEAELDLSRLAGLRPHPAMDPLDSLAGVSLRQEAPLRQILEATAEFSSYSKGVSLFVLARLHRAWTESLAEFPEGEEGLIQFFCERVLAHGGEIRRQEKVSAILHKQGKITGALLEGVGDRTIGCDFLLTSQTHQAFLERVGECTQKTPLYSNPIGWRYVLSVLVRQEGIPAALGRESILFFSWEANAHALSPIHLQKQATDAQGFTLLVAETFLPAEPPSFAEVRTQILTTLERYLPFVEQHYLVVDSPHDGLPLWDFRSGSRVNVSRERLKEGGGSLLAEPMIPQWRCEKNRVFGWGGDPLRALLDGVFLVGPGTLPALGQEGELLAAWAAARAIGKTNQRREKMQRAMWNATEV